MPVNTGSAEYVLFGGQWTRCRDAFRGQDTIKSKTIAHETYLRKLAGMEGDDAEEKRSWATYVDRALWFNATKRTMRAFSGFVFRKDPVTKWLNRQVEERTQDITMGGVSMNAYARRVVAQQIRVGRFGTLVTLSADGSRGRFAGYEAEAILDAHTTMFNGSKKLAHLRLVEPMAAVPSKDDEWRRVHRLQVRVLELDAEGLLNVRLFVPDAAKNNEYVETLLDEDTQHPKRAGVRLDFIPFVFTNVTHTEPPIEEPPLLDLVDVNIDHFKLDANYKYGLEKTSIPQYWLAGFKFAMTQDTETTGHDQELIDKVPIGGDYAWVSEDANARAGIVEYTGQGLKPLKEEREQDEDRMAVLGARILETPKAGVEAAATMEVRHSGEKSMLAEMARTAEDSLQNALGILSWWEGWAETVTVPEDQQYYRLNKDYVSARMTAEMLREMTSALLSGSISYGTYYYALEQGELTRPGVDVEKEQDDIANQAPINPAVDDDEDEDDKDQATQKTGRQPTERSQV